MGGGRVVSNLAVLSLLSLGRLMGSPLALQGLTEVFRAKPTIPLHSLNSCRHHGLRLPKGLLKAPLFCLEFSRISGLSPV